jgi:hypothetical protein
METEAAFIRSKDIAVLDPIAFIDSFFARVIRPMDIERDDLVGL